MREHGIERVAVLGAGTMGHGIAQAVAQAGCTVRLYDVDTAAAERGAERIRANLDKGIELGKVTAAKRDEVLDRISTTADLEAAVGDADLVIEAAPESLELKRELLARVEAAAPEDALLATNTSSLRIGEIAAGLSRPEAFLGLHFFNPVHIMKLVEVVMGEGTAEAVTDRGVAFVRALGKEPVVVKDSPGFASSRLGLALGLEAMRMLEEGVASAEDIDKAMELGYRHPMGPLRLTDLIGLDVRLGIAEYLYAELGSEAFRPPQILRDLVAEGRLGKKTGRGIYDWERE